VKLLAQLPRRNLIFNWPQTGFEPVFESRSRFRQTAPAVAQQHGRNNGTRLKHAALKYSLVQISGVQLRSRYASERGGEGDHMWSREEIACSVPNAAAEALAVSSCEVQTAFSS
jgi:hypothetical protein